MKKFICIIVIILHYNIIAIFDFKNFLVKNIVNQSFSFAIDKILEKHYFFFLEDKNNKYFFTKKFISDTLSSFILEKIECKENKKTFYRKMFFWA